MHLLNFEPLPGGHAPSAGPISPPPREKEEEKEGEDEDEKEAEKEDETVSAAISKKQPHVNIIATFVNVIAIVVPPSLSPSCSLMLKLSLQLGSTLV